jgi:hypothetical protein
MTMSKDSGKQAKNSEGTTDATAGSPGASGISSNLQPGGTIPGKSPAAGVGSIGTGGGSTANAPSGAVKKGI